MLFLVVGKNRSKVAAAIVRQTFMFQPLMLYPYRAHFGDAFVEITEREASSLAAFRHLVLSNINTIDTFRANAFVSLVRRRVDAARVTILTNDTALILDQMPDDLRKQMSRNLIIT
jgi:hypothetical protein